MWSAEVFLHELETKKVHQILMSFTNSFRTVHSPILNMDPSLNLSKVYALVIAKVKHYNLVSTRTPILKAASPNH